LAEPQASRARARGCVIAAGAQLAELLAPLGSGGRELLLVELAGDAADLAERAAELESVRTALVERGVDARAACFTSSDPETDLVRLAAEQEAELLVVSSPLEGEAPCDVAVAPRADLPFRPEAAVLVPFAGDKEEWAALELGAWLARAHGLPLRLLGAEARDGRRDASGMLASASL